MKIFIASLVIGLLAFLAGRNADQQVDWLCRQVSNLPPSGTRVPKPHSGAKPRVVDTIDIPVNPFDAPDDQNRAVHKDPDKQMQLESARLWYQIVPIAYRVAWMAPVAGLVLLIATRIKLRMMPQDEAFEGKQELAVEADAPAEQAQETAAEPTTQAAKCEKGGA
jgi:hypothetical protein